MQTGDTSVESGNVLGKITFNAPVEGSGTDAILDGAAIEAVAEDTFASDNNSTALVFKTKTSAAATERMRIKSDGTIVMDTQVDIDNITIDGNTISSTDTNGNVVIAPHGTGDVQLDADTVRVGDNNANATITTNGTGDLTFSTNAGTNSGVITIADAANGNISITPNGSGTVVMDKVDIGGGAIDGTPVGANSASTGAFTAVDVDNININGNTISSTDTNGNVVIDPAGTGNIHLGVFHFDADQSSLTDRATGKTQHNFTNVMNSTHYAVSGIALDEGESQAVMDGCDDDFTDSAKYEVNTFSTDNTARDCDKAYTMCCGDLA